MLVKNSIGSYAILGENIETSLVTFADSRVRGLSCRVTLWLRIFLLCSWHCRSPWSFHRCSSCSGGDMPVVVRQGMGSRRADNCGFHSCGCRCAYTVTWWGLVHSRSASDSSRRLRTFLLRWGWSAQFLLCIFQLGQA